MPKWKAVLVFNGDAAFLAPISWSGLCWILLLAIHASSFALLWLGIISEPLPAVHNSFRGRGGGSHIRSWRSWCWPIHSSLEKIDLRLVEASFDLIRQPLQTIKRVICRWPFRFVAAARWSSYPHLGLYHAGAARPAARPDVQSDRVPSFGAARNWPFARRPRCSCWLCSDLAVAFCPALRGDLEGFAMKLNPSAAAASPRRKALAGAVHAPTAVFFAYVYTCRS